MRCGMCQSVCPVYQVTRREPDVARGKFIIISGLLDELFEEARGVSERLQKCLLCGSCEHACTSGVKCLEIFIRARAIIAAYRGLPYWKRLFLRRILASRKRFDKLAKIVALSKPLIDKSLRFGKVILKDRILIPPVGSSYIIPARTVPGYRSIKVSVFFGCLVEKVFPSVAEATIRVLNAVDAYVSFSHDQVCCGAPAISMGDAKAFRALLVQNIKVLSGQTDMIVTPCATCAAIIKRIWPVMVEEESPEIQEQVRLIADKIVDITEFIHRYAMDKVCTDTKHSPVAKLKVTYHDPCHLRKSLKIWKEPRNILRSLNQYEFVEMPAADSCCGFGGSFRMSFPHISEKIGMMKAKHIINSGADIVTTSCPGCMIQLHDMLLRSGLSMPVKHFVELVVENFT